MQNICLERIEILDTEKFGERSHTKYCCILRVYLFIIIMISITTVHIQIENTIGRLKYTGDSVVQIRTVY